MTQRKKEETLEVVQEGKYIRRVVELRNVYVYCSSSSRVRYTAL
jgi:hypothetical protein